MITVFSIEQGGSAKLVLRNGVSTFAANRTIYLSKVDWAGRLVGVDQIGDPELGIMVPSKRYKGSMMRSDFIGFDSSYYRTSVRPDNGIQQNPVYHDTFKGEIHLVNTQAQTEDIEWNGETLTLSKVGDAYFVSTSDTFSKLLCNGNIWRCNIAVNERHESYCVVITSTAEAVGWNYGVYRTRVYCSYYENGIRKQFESYKDISWWNWSPSDPPAADEDWAWEQVHSLVFDPIYMPNVAEQPASSIPYNRTKVVAGLQRLANNLRSRYSLNVLPLHDEMFPELCIEAIDDCRFVKTNQLEFWKDVALTFNEVGAAKELANTLADVVTEHPVLKRKAHDTFVKLKKFKSGNPDIDKRANDMFLRDLEQDILKSEAKTVAKAASNSYLATYYGTRLAMSDIEEISRGLSDFIWTYYSEFRKAVRFAHKGGKLEGSFAMLDHEVEWSTELNYTLCYNPYTGISEINEILKELGLIADFHQIWECVPLSFTVDWLADITKVLNALDDDAYLHTLSINYEQLGRETTFSVSSLVEDVIGIPFTGIWHCYRRTYSDKPTITPAASDIWGSPQKHFIQGAALLLQRG